jgi:hypothetical protein
MDGRSSSHDARAASPASRNVPDLPRRAVLGGASLALGAVPLLSGTRPASAQPLGTAAAVPPATEPAARPVDGAMLRRARMVRESCAIRADAAPVAPHPANDDEARYPSRIGTDTRGLPHDARGEVEPAAWRAMFDACQSGDPADFDKIPLGGVRKLGNPLGTMAVSLAGLTPTQFAIPAAPALASAERAAEAVELYWQALLRDVPLAEFQDGTTHRDVLAACEELSRLAAFRGRVEGRVTPGTIFRGAALYHDPANPMGRSVTPAGVLDGPMVSQLLLRDVPYGAQWISARMRPAARANEFLTEPGEWLKAQNGEAVGGRIQFDATPRYLSSGRDLAELVRPGPLLVWTVAMLLLTPTSGADARYGGMFPVAQPALNPSNPYRRSPNQGAGAATFGAQHIQAVLAEGVNRAPRAAYWQKWFVHRTLRPEAYGGLAQHRLANGVTDYPLHDVFLRSEALDRTRAKQGSHLLSQASPEGSPFFSAYPGGGAAIGGVVATLLKAFFDESRVITDPVQPDPQDPTRLVPYSGPPLTVGGELNKLGANLAVGRAWMGIHWWSDTAASMALGEEVAIALLRDERATYREAFDGFSFTRFDGSRITI